MELRDGVVAGAVVADVVGVLVFVVAGRRAHAGESAPVDVVVGTLGTAWPYLVGLALGWALARAGRRPTQVWPAGVAVWATTVVLGTALRGITGGGLAPSFLVVSSVALAVLLLGWRAGVALLRVVRG